MKTGAALVNSGGLNNRLTPILRHYYRFNQLFVVDAAGSYVLQANNRILFEQGADDTNSNLANAGYQAVVGGAAVAMAPSVQFTSCFKGGALHPDKACRLLSLGIEPLGIRTRVTAASVGWTAALCPGVSNVAAQMGLETLREAQVAEELVRVALLGTVAELLEVGSNSGCTHYLGLPQQFASGLAPQNSGYPSMGTGLPAARWTFAQPVIVPASTGDSNYQPNRIQLTHAAQAGASSVGSVAVNPNFGALANGDFVAVDFMAVLDFARLNVTVDGNGDITDAQPFEDIDAARIAQLEGAV